MWTVTEMPMPLFTVEETFSIKGRGLVIVGIAAEQYGSFATGDPLMIRRPDGTTVQAIVRGVEYPPSVKYIGERPRNPRYGVLVDAADVPVGSVVMSGRRPQ
jgi:hypothetical protein